MLGEKWILPNDTFDIGFISFRISLTHSYRYYYYFSVSMDSRQPIDTRDQWQIYYAHSMCISYSYDLHFDCQFGHIIHASNISRVYPIHTFLSRFVFSFIFQLFFAFYVAFEIKFMIYHTCTHTHHFLFFHWSAISRSGQVFFIMCQNQYSFRILQHYKVQQTKMKANFQAKAFFDFTASTRLFGRLKFYLRFVLDNWCIFICFAYTRCTTKCLYSIATFRYHLLFRLIGEIFGFTLSWLAFRIITNCSVSILFANTATVMLSKKNTLGCLHGPNNQLN